MAAAQEESDIAAPALFPGRRRRHIRQCNHEPRDRPAAGIIEWGTVAGSASAHLDAIHGEVGGAHASAQLAAGRSA